MKTLGLILARGGSKRCPGKNIRPLGGKPLIAWTIEAALASGVLDRVIVSSDSDDILTVAWEYGAEPLRRPWKMATDEASSYPVMIHAMDYVGPAYERICLLQPTSPFRTAEDIRIAYHGMTGCKAIVSAECGKHRPNGAIYLGDAGWLRGALDDGHEYPFDLVQVYSVMPAERSLDIDTEEDFAMAELMVREAA